MFAAESRYIQIWFDNAGPMPPPPRRMWAPMQLSVGNTRRARPAAMRHGAPNAVECGEIPPAARRRVWIILERVFHIRLQSLGRAARINAGNRDAQEFLSRHQALIAGCVGGRYTRARHYDLGNSQSHHDHEHNPQSNK